MRTDATRLLADAGEALHGPEWQRALARALGPHHPDGARPAIDDRLVRRWTTAERPVPGWVWPVLARMLRTRIGDLEAQASHCLSLAEQLERRGE